MKKEKINSWKQQNEKLLEDMDNWRNQYKCRNNCNVWQQNKFCNHLVNSREKYFKDRIDKQLDSIKEVLM